MHCDGIRCRGKGKWKIGRLIRNTFPKQLFNIPVSFAAAPDVFPPDKFNAGVLVIQPNEAVFQDMVSRIAVLPSHDGGDTGFLNSYFPTWFSQSADSRLSFGYNAQRTLHWFTHAKYVELVFSIPAASRE